MSNDNKVTGHNLDTSEGARAYVAEFFANQVRRHDFRAYITTRLAADFACALAKHLAAQSAGHTFQGDVATWMDQCFPPSLSSNMTERGDRLLEEVLELLQAHGYDSARVPILVNYVFGRPVGEPAQEVGGVMITLAAYCSVAGLTMQADGLAELDRINQPEVMARIREKQEAKNALHFDTPLPGNADQPSPAGQDVRAQFEAWAHAQSYRGGNIITDRDADHPDVYACPNAQLTWQCWKAALAARQPVEFERAVPTRRRESAVELLLSLGFVWNNQRWEDRRQPVRQARNPLQAYADSYRLMAELSVDGRVSATSVAYDIETNMAPHAAPPAQAVDLGQFRECVELMEWQEREHANPDFPRGDAKKHAEALRLLALIDSKAVGNG